MNPNPIPFEKEFPDEARFLQEVYAKGGSIYIFAQSPKSLFSPPQVIVCELKYQDEHSRQPTENY